MRLAKNISIHGGMGRLWLIVLEEESALLVNVYYKFMRLTKNISIHGGIGIGSG